MRREVTGRIGVDAEGPSRPGGLSFRPHGAAVDLHQRLVDRDRPAIEIDVVPLNLSAKSSDRRKP